RDASWASLRGTLSALPSRRRLDRTRRAAGGRDLPALLAALVLLAAAGSWSTPGSAADTADPRPASATTAGVSDPVEAPAIGPAALAAEAPGSDERPHRRMGGPGALRVAPRAAQLIAVRRPLVRMSLRTSDLPRGDLA